MSYAVFDFNTKLGNMVGVRQDDFLIGLGFTTQDENKPTKRLDDGLEKILFDKISSFADGELKKFDLKVRLIGTPFQVAVWQALRKIPYGETRSYAEVARTIKRPSAVRAVASAIAKNPIAIIVPCHRVIRSDGQIGKYAWGEDVKKKLLRLERQKSQGQM